MLIIAVFTRAKTQKKPRCPLMDKRYRRCSVCVCVSIHTHTHTNGIYSAIKKNEILPFETMWMELEYSMLTEISQSEKGNYHMISLICGIYKEFKATSIWLVNLNSKHISRITYYNRWQSRVRLTEVNVNKVETTSVVK